MGATMIEKLIRRNTGSETACAGDIVTVSVDRVMIHDIFIPFVAAYIWYAWRALNRRPVTREELRDEEHTY